MRSIVCMIAALHSVIFVMWFAHVQLHFVVHIFPWKFVFCAAPISIRPFSFIAAKRPVYLVFFFSPSPHSNWSGSNNGSRHGMSLNGFYGQLFCQRVIRNGMGKFIVVLWQCWLLTEFSPASAKMNYCKHLYSTLCSVSVCSPLLLLLLCSLFWVFHFQFIFAVMSIVYSTAKPFILPS